MGKGGNKQPLGCPPFPTKIPFIINYYLEIQTAINKIAKQKPKKPIISTPLLKIKFKNKIIVFDKSQSVHQDYVIICSSYFSLLL